MSFLADISIVGGPVKLQAGMTGGKKGRKETDTRMEEGTSGRKGGHKEGRT